MDQPIFTVDAFTSKPFAGNPAAVCPLVKPRDDKWMQAVAREMNLSETAFLQPRDDGYDLRWFTPGAEVDLCGHATLASAHILWEQEMLRVNEPARFHTKSGLLTASRIGDRITMDFPAEPPAPTDPPDELLTALDVAAQWVGQNRHDFFVEVESEDVLRNVRPDFRKLAALGTRGVIITAKADAAAAHGADFVSRYFVPAFGIDEDPVTGSAHCCLGPYWQERLNKDELVGYQASRRGGTVYVKPRGDRVELAGYAVTVSRGALLV